jgi:hypothetical protein
MDEDEKLSKKSNDFFNLNSDDDEDDETELANKKHLDEQLRKWDWDRAENFSLYYKHNKEKISDSDTANLKRSVVTTESDEELCETKKRIRTDPFSIEKVHEQVKHESVKLKFNLNGHTGSVNRINWCKKPQNRHLLLSSSMDG